MATNKLTQQTCEEVDADTAETIALNYINYFRVTNTTGAALYIKFDWDAGDTEVSANNYDVYIANGSYAEFISRSPTFPRMRNVRVLTSNKGRVSIIGW